MKTSDFHMVKTMERLKNVTNLIDESTQKIAKAKDRSTFKKEVVTCNHYMNVLRAYTNCIQDFLNWGGKL